MRYTPRIIILFLLTFAAAPQSSYATFDWHTKVDAAVLSETAGGNKAEFLIILSEQADLSAADMLPTTDEKRRYVYETLTAVALGSQPPLLSYLKAQGIPHRSYWIHNMIWARGDATAVQAVARRADVATIQANPWLQLVPQSAEVQRSRLVLSTVERGAEKNLLISQSLVSDLRSPEWNLEQINAPAVWAGGNIGQGVVIGGQDTGFDWTHPALIDRYRGWDGSTANHNYNWHDAIHGDNPNTPPGNSCGFDLQQPCDDNSHGTHTMGTMVGDDGQGNQTGVAPGAQWIACRNMEQGWGSPATYTECFEWFVAPYPAGGDPFTDGDPARAPHVINNSWSCTSDEGCLMPDALRAVVEAVRVAGIVTVQAAGNSGSACASVSTPAAIYDGSFTVGATGPDDQIASFSSRGPVLADGSGRLKPNITAPGELIRSTLPGESYGFSNGTSMAAPHIAGVVALLISADPALAGQVDEVEELIEQTAVPLTTTEGCGEDGNGTVPNNVYGWGRVDALAAVEAISQPLLDFKIHIPVFVATE
jgi:subtilisin family serine protease